MRLKLEGEDGAELAQILYEGFQDDVELRVHAEGVKVMHCTTMHPAICLLVYLASTILPPPHWSVTVTWNTADGDVFQSSHMSGDELQVL